MTKQAPKITKPQQGKKNVVMAYILWIVLGYVGAHRIYAGRPGSALILITLFASGIAFGMIQGGWLVLLTIGALVLLDAIFIPAWIRHCNAAADFHDTDLAMR